MVWLRMQPMTVFIPESLCFMERVHSARAGCQPVTEIHGKGILALDIIGTPESFIGKCCRGYLMDLKSELLESSTLVTLIAG